MISHKPDQSNLIEELYRKRPLPVNIFRIKKPTRRTGGAGGNPEMISFRTLPSLSRNLSFHFRFQVLTACSFYIFKAVMDYIIREDHVDLQHLYIDGLKFEANANKYTWVWKKATEKSRYRLFEQINKEILFFTAPFYFP